jgi:hypothetical protein
VELRDPQADALAAVPGQHEDVAQIREQRGVADDAGKACAARPS